jgi:hypothetical protein
MMICGSASDGLDAALPPVLSVLAAHHSLSISARYFWGQELHSAEMLRGARLARAQNISPTMDGTIVALGMSALICVVWTLIWPEKDGVAFANYKSIELEDQEEVVDHYAEDPQEMNRALKVCSCLVSISLRQTWHFLSGRCQAAFLVQAYLMAQTERQSSMRVCMMVL